MGYERDNKRHKSEEQRESEESDDDEEEDEVCRSYSWHVGIICAIVVFVMFMLLHSPGVQDWLTEQIPDGCRRTICAGLILAAITFLVVGLAFYKLNPIQDTTEQRPAYNCMKDVL